MSYYRSPEHRYDPSDPGVRIIKNASGLDEFHGYTGDCGQAAAEVQLALQHGYTPNIEEMNSMVRSMISHGEASGSGATSLRALKNELARRGLNVYINSDWRAGISTYAGIRALTMGLGNAGVLPGEHPGVHGHFICIVGLGPKGYVASDPNTIAAKDQKLVYFTASELAAAKPWGILVPDKDAVGGDNSGGGPGDPGVDPSIFPCPPPSWWPSWLPYPRDCSGAGADDGGAKQEFGTQRAHDVLQEMPGFLGIASGIDQIETITPFDPPQGLLNTPKVPGYAAGWLIGNTASIAVRAAIVMTGLIMILILVLAAVRKPVAEVLQVGAQVAGVPNSPIVNGVRGGPPQGQQAPSGAMPPQQQGQPGQAAPVQNGPVAPANAPTVPMRVVP